MKECLTAAGDERGSVRRVPRTSRRGGVALLVCSVALVPAAVGCSHAASSAPGHPAAASQSSVPGVTEHAVNGRFTVVLSGRTQQVAQTAGISLRDLIAPALGRVNGLLPGPRSTITVNRAQAGDLIPQAGVFGFTNPLTARITVAFGATPHVSLAKALTFWFPRDLAHEVSHSVRILAGPGFGTTLLPQLITEGIATAFDQAAFPGPPDPWTHAITPTQECVLWKRAKPQLGGADLYDLWMFGGPHVPHWAGFTIGYHIVAGYRRHHPDTTWAALTATSAATILAGSQYRPCPR
jgi:hypothetical protein